MVLSTAATRIILLYLMSNFGKLAASMEGSIASLEANNNEIDDINSYDFNEPQNKRTYTYVSEYKRLPVYNFGLGKRQTYGDKRIKPYSFGIGKRSQGYSFGIGKKRYPTLNLDYPQFSSYEVRLHPDIVNLLEEKRNNRVYGFGLGKRSLEIFPVFAENLAANPKRGSSEYSFGLGKKSLEDPMLS